MDLHEVLLQVKEKTKTKGPSTINSSATAPDADEQGNKKGKNKPETNAKQNSDKGQANKAKEGDHLVVFWDGGGDRLWYLGVVE